MDTGPAPRQSRADATSIGFFALSAIIAVALGAAASIVPGKMVDLTDVGLLAALVGTLLTVLAAIATLVWTRKEIRALPSPEANAGGADASTSGGQPLEQFETAALASYYTSALRRANISFAFSLIAAAGGFIIIATSVLSYDPSDALGAVIKGLSGTVIDAVAGLFFVQSNSAQQSMQAFFEKLRLDRAAAQALKLIGDTENPERRDLLRAQLVLKLAEIDKLVVDPSL